MMIAIIIVNSYWNRVCVLQWEWGSVVPVWLLFSE